MTTTPRPVRTLLALVATAALATTAACSGKEEPGPGPDPSPSTTASSTSPSPSPSTTSSTSPTPTVPAGFSMTEQASPGWPALGPDLGVGRESRVGRHEGYDRVVYEFTGPDAPNYRVHYVDRPIGDGSGAPVAVAGDVWLEVLVTSLGIPGESAPTADDPLPETLRGTGIAAADALWGGFEGVGQAFIGLDGEQRPFTVSTATNPSRLIVDIAR